MKAKEVNKYIFKSKAEETFVVKPSTMKGIYDSQGTLIQFMNIKPIKLEFNNCHSVVDEEFAKQHDMEIEDLIKLIKDQPYYQRGYWLIHSPEKKVSSEEISKMTEKKGRKQILGTRK